MTDASFLSEAQFVRGMARLCSDGWAQGWHERNAGNLSYRLLPDEAQVLRANGRSKGAWKGLSSACPHLAGSCLAVTGTGKYFRNVADKPEECIGVLEIAESGDAYRVIWGFAGGAQPTSELDSHLAVHEAYAAEGSTNRVLYHAHTPFIIAMTNLIEDDSQTVTRALWSTMIECMLFFPQGIGVVEPMVPGGQAIARKTVSLLRSHDAVIWSHHGILCPGSTFDEAFGLVHIIEKSAKIWCDVQAACKGGAKSSGVSLDMLREIAQAYNLAVHEGYLAN